MDFKGLRIRRISESKGEQKNCAFCNPQILQPKLIAFERISKLRERFQSDILFLPKGISLRRAFNFQNSLRQFSSKGCSLKQIPKKKLFWYFYEICNFVTFADTFGSAFEAKKRQPAADRLQLSTILLTVRISTRDHASKSIKFACLKQFKVGLSFKLAETLATSTWAASADECLYAFI